MKSLSHFTRTLLPLFFLLGFGIKGYAVEFSQSNWSVSYSQCSGYVQIEILYYNDHDGFGTVPDWMQTLDVYFVTASGTDQRIFRWRHEDETCNNCDYSHTHAGETWNYDMSSSGSTTWESASVPNTDDEQKKMIIRYYALPNNLIGTTVTIRIDGLWHGGGTGDADVVFDNWDKTVSVPAINAPTNLTASVDEDCDYVQLEWTNPSNPCPNNEWEILVLRDGQILAGIEGLVTQYNDNTAVKGQTYDYSIYALMRPNSFMADISDVTPEVEGRRLGPLPAPTNVTASRDRCDGKIQVQWVWSNPGNPASYIIERKPSSGGSYTRIDTIPGTNLQYLDNTPSPEVEYLYRIRNINTCGDTSTASLPTDPAGLAAGIPAAPTNVMAVDGPASIIVSWTDNSNAENGFIIERTYTGGGSPLVNEVAANVTTWTDNSVLNCVTYTYVVKAKSVCHPSGNGNGTASQRIQQDLSNTFPDGSFNASKGYDPDKVILEWNNNNPNLINTVRIYRRALESGDNFALLFTLNSGSGIYNDLFAQAGVLYEYLIYAEGQCENETIYSDSTTSIGFRRKVGTITGQVTYAGGTAVENVKISAESTSGIYGRSLSLPGGSNNLIIPDDNTLDFDSTFLFEAWVKRTGTNSGKLFTKENTLAIEYDSTANQYKVTVYKTGNQSLSTTIAGSLIPINNYAHLAVQIYQRKLQIYVNGTLEKDQSLSSLFSGAIQLNLTDSDYSIGKYFKGLMDEIRVWRQPKSPEQIQRDFSRIMIGTEPGLIVYLGANEGVGRFAYDASKTGTLFNKHHAEFTGAVTWSTDIPTTSQLSVANYTNESGNYILVIPYNGAGEVFEISPAFTIHEFEPSVTALFVGDGASVHNNVNFRDKSSFRVTGTVSFKNTTCGVPNAFLKVDGELLITEGAAAKTDATGAFDIQVPIGMHHLEVEQAGHVYAVGRFPASGKHNFQEDLAGIAFLDSTEVLVIGRVVGGLREANKTPGMGLSKNNIGVARIILTSQQGNGCSTDTIFTDANTGEYEIMLPPLKYVPTVTIPSNPGIDFDGLDLVDLSGTPTLTTAYDTIFDVDGDVVSIDSVQFHRRLDYIHRVPPVISVVDRDGISPFIGDSIYTYTDPITNLPVNRNLRNEPFRWPVFSQRNGGDYIYRCMIKVYEPYINITTGLIDSVPTTDGILSVDNEFADLTHAELKLKDYNTPDTLKSIVYSFKPGQPNFLENISIPEYSYTRKLEINVIPSSGNAIAWLPVTNIPPGGDAIYRAYLLGTQTSGEEFVTFGPQVTEYVLRDPPGSNSKASREVGSTKTEKSTWNWNLGGAVHTKDNIYLGAKFSIGLGVSTATEIENNTSAGFKAEIGGGNSGEQIITTTNTKEWSTNDAQQLAPGAPSDVYIGKSTNLQYGLAEELSIIPADLCSNVECIGGSGSAPDPGFSFGKKYGIAIVPGGYETNFQFTEYSIKYNIIPDLINLRDAMLQSNPKYTSHIAIGEENYGLNNDDPAFGDDASTDTPDQGDFEDLTGPSYTYAATSLQDSIGGDSVRVLNIQIDKWVDAIQLNEWEKVNIDNEEAINSLWDEELEDLEEEYLTNNQAYEYLAFANAVGGIVVAYGLIVTPGPGTAFAGYATFAVTTATSIALAEITEKYNEYLAKKDRINAKFALAGSAINYTLSGGTSLSASMTHESTISRTQSVEYTMSAELLLEVEGKVNNNGVGLEKGIELSHTTGRDWSTDTLTTEVVSFTLEDQDVGDLYSVDVFPSLLGWGPIFKNKAGGATSCPHEDAVVTEYYEPGTIVSERTLQIEKPVISSSQSILTNIPSDEAAVFNLTLGNASENGYTNSYNLAVVAASNPFGAIVRFDGLPAQSIIMPAATSINKVMTIEKGPGPVFNYDSILIIFVSPCQYQGGAGFNTDIGDSIYVSAHFLPSCTDVALASPEDKWVLNNSFNDTMPVAIVDYNINFDGLENIRYEYKPSSSANWIGLQTYLKDTTGAGGLPIPTTTPFTLYDWDVAQLTDGLYDVRVTSTCANDVQNFSPVYSGVMDRINPHPFGNPSPADGILSPNDEISIRFNEPVDLGSISAPFNFDIRGVINGTETDHSTSLSFDGVNDFLEAEGGLPVQKRDFTIELSAKRARTGEEALISQGTDSNESMFFGFNSANKLVFRVNGTEVATNAAFTDQEWHYFAVSYDYEGEIAQIFVADESTTAYVANNGNTTFYPDMTATGAMEIGRFSPTKNKYFQGQIHEVRVWNTARTLNQFNVSKSTLIDASAPGILYNWRMDEAEGNVAAEHIRRRDADIYGATWTIAPNGNAAQFDGFNDVLEIETGDVAITKGMDFTLEFWFNASDAFDGTLFSNGNADSLSIDSLNAWEIVKTSAGTIVVKHHGMEFTAVEQNFFDGNWHHFALVMQRSGNLSAYIDGDLQNSTQAIPFGQFAGSHMYLGAKGYREFNMPYYEDYFTGQLDEFRFWNTARKLAQLRRDKRHRMMGDEAGLKVYLPFEAYSLDPTGIPLLDETFDDQAASAHTVNVLNNVTLTTQTPTIKLQRPVQHIAFTYSVNNDQIILTPTTSPEIIENVTLDITVTGIKDLHGNVMESPATWIAYMDKNQVVWQDDQLNFDLIRGDELSFTSAVINQGGAAKAFTIENIPSWLTVTPSSGTVNPNSSIPVAFEVADDIRLGDYTQDLLLLTDFNYPERLTLDLKVRDKAPEWNFDPSIYQFNMSIIGRIKINGVISTDDEDRIIAMVGQDIRGIGQLEYVPELDVYLVFMDVYSQATSTETLSFRIWDASAGLIYTDVIPTNLQFASNLIVGTASAPLTFESGNTVSFEIPVHPGWTWLGFPLEVPNPRDLNTILISLTHTAGDEIKSQDHYANYNGNSNQFVGDLDDPGNGIKPEQMYKLYNQLDDILIMKGTVINPATKPISLKLGWTWMGFISIRPQSLEQALGNLMPAPGDIIKGKSKFAIYDAGAGWLGSLNTLEPGYGYMYKSAAAKTFTFPTAGMFNNFGGEGPPVEIRSQRWTADASVYNLNMTLVGSTEINCIDLRDSESLYVGARDHAGQWRGIAPLTKVGDQNIFYLTVAGGTPELLDIYLMDDASGQVFLTGETIVFQANAHEGNISSPWKCALNDDDCEQIVVDPVMPAASALTAYPSPFREQLVITYTAVSDADEAQLMVRDMAGRTVYVNEVDVRKGENHYYITSSNDVFSPGMYTLELRTTVDQHTIKIVKSN